MKRIRLILLLSLPVLLSIQCQKSPPIDFEGENCSEGMPEFEPENTNKREYDFRFFTNSRLLISESDRIDEVKIVSGDKIVFQYEYVKDDKPNIADDEYTERIFFEIPADLDAFIIGEEDLKSSNAVFGAFCFCLDYGYFWIDKGCIKGEKVDEKTWNVAINISAQASQRVFSQMLSEPFKKD